MDNSTKAILITGTSKGIGKYLCEYYLGKGYRVFGCSRSKPDFSSSNYSHNILSVTDEASVIEMFVTIRRSGAQLEALINNAGIASMNHFLMTPLSTIESILATNVTGTLLFSREAAKLMKKNSFGRIINLSSVAVPMSIEGEAVYAASKAAVNSFTKVLAKELATFNITVNAIGLTPAKTDLIKNVPEEKIKGLVDRLTVKRLMEFPDISNVTDFLLQKESGYVTGQVINLGGA